MDYSLLHDGARSDKQGGIQSAGIHRQLAAAVRELGVPVTRTTGHDAFIEQIGAANPGVVFVCFAPSPTLIDAPDQDQELGEGVDAINKAIQLVAQLARLSPGLPLVAVGSAADGCAMLAALRVGVKNFADVDGAPVETVRVVRRLLVERVSAEPTCCGRVLVMLGAYPGIGATTLATGLAVLVRRTSASDTMLFGLGQLLHDDALYLDVQINFHFVEAVHNLRRFDQVSMQTVLSHHPNGLIVLSLLISLANMCDVPFSEALDLLNRLHAFSGLWTVDLGGFGSISFIAQIIKVADDVILVIEQNVDAIVSAAEPMQELRKREIDRDHLHLTISKFDARLSLDTVQVAERLEIPSVLTMPNRHEALVIASNQDVTPAETHPTDAYVRVLAWIAQTLGYTQQSAYTSALSSWVSGVSARLSERSSGRSRRKSADAIEPDIGAAERNTT